MKFKFFPVLISAVIISCSVQAQKKPTTILRAGVDLAYVSQGSGTRFNQINTLTTYQAGFIFDIPVVKVLSIQSGFVYTGKGAKTVNGNPSSSTTYYKATTNPFYIEVPFNFVLKCPGKYKFFVGAGPYVAVGVAGKNKVEGKILNNYFKSDRAIKFSDDDPTTLDYEEGAGFGIMRRFDYGFNGTFGVETKKYILSANYGYGLAKLQSGTHSGYNDDTRDKHRVVSFTIGFKL